MWGCGGDGGSQRGARTVAAASGGMAAWVTASGDTAACVHGGGVVVMRGHGGVEAWVAAVTCVHEGGVHAPWRRGGDVVV